MASGLEQLKNIFAALALRVALGVFLAGIPIIGGVYAVVSFVVDKALGNINSTLETMNHRIGDVQSNIKGATEAVTKVLEARMDGVEGRLRAEFTNTRELIRKASIDNKNFATSVWFLKDGRDQIEVNFPTVINGPTITEILTSPQFATFSRRIALSKKITTGDIIFAVAPTNEAFSSQGIDGKSLEELIITKTSDANAWRTIVRNFPQCAEFVTLGQGSLYFQPKANVIYTNQGVICPLERPN
jgi:hypothetical protein